MRNFEDEYKNYIKEDVPDLWSRIEPQLKDKVAATSDEIEKDKKGEGITKENATVKIGEFASEGKNAEGNTKTNVEKKNDAKIYSFVKRALPIAAALCILIIGISAIQLSTRSKMQNESATSTDSGASDEAYYEEAASEDACESAEAYDEMYDAEAEYDEAPMEPTVVESAAADMSDERDRDASKEAAEVTKDVGDVAMNTAASPNESVGVVADDLISIKNAELVSIEVADANMKNAGYAYVYVFKSEDDQKIYVYLTDEQCEEIENDGPAITRGSSYNLEIYLMNDSEMGDEKQASDATSTYGCLYSIELTK